MAQRVTTIEKLVRGVKGIDKPLEQAMSSLDTDYYKLTLSGATPGKSATVYIKRDHVIALQPTNAGGMLVHTARGLFDVRQGPNEAVWR